MIPPTIGRVVWFFDENFKDGDQPKAALVTFVHNENCVNLATFTHDGHAGSYQHVFLVQEGQEKPADSVYATWMPYQIGQAKKHEAEDKKTPEKRGERATGDKQ